MNTNCLEPLMNDAYRKSTCHSFGGTKRAEAVIAKRSTKREQPITVIVQILERYGDIVESELKTLDGLLSRSEWVKLLDSNPTSMLSVDEIRMLPTNVLGCDEDYWDRDPNMPLAQKIANLSITQRIALGDLMECCFRGELHDYNGDVFEIAEKAGLVFSDS